MTLEHPSKLSFSIEESVWLNKGQEVEEILGMSLEPEIVIEERDHHVYIKGGLRLVGEYRSQSSDDAIDVNSASLSDQVSFRSAGDVTVSSNGTGEIKHFFPIDVTIPIARIQNLDDVYVQVDSFDYDLPEKSCIQLTADISISGMTQSLESPDRVEEVEEPSQPVDETPELEQSQPIPTAFSFEARRRPELEYPEQPKPYPTPLSTPYQRPMPTYQSYNPNHSPQQPPAFQHSKVEPVEKQVEFEETPSAREQHQEEEEPTLKATDSQYDDNQLELEEEVVREEAAVELEDEVEEVEAIAETEEVDTIAEEEVEHVLEAREERQPEPETKINLAPLKEMAKPLAEVQSSAEGEASGDSETKPAPPREENALYLTKMLSKGEERFSKWRMCIIQENESLDTIADRYEISTSQLMRLNRLQGEQVEEGQILYIPVKMESQ
ncbi:stage VI sporulation protein D [Halalkalibacter krulwichiae]|uniref:Stage VI sporulation protein D n=1 Tax=Halalkalibacter krulwichiae TaxID=199441 RepID=A0A1X9MDX4_9BACI|nr:stage VI sporulation protein D [Halalkalibacter krulwichiae]ARK31616.1 Stage VI sporulation protein D [Halalkalibacter krulwichiae]